MQRYIFWSGLSSDALLPRRGTESQTFGFLTPIVYQRVTGKAKLLQNSCEDQHVESYMGVNRRRKILNFLGFFSSVHRQNFPIPRSPLETRRIISLYHSTRCAEAVSNSSNRWTYSHTLLQCILFHIHTHNQLHCGWDSGPHGDMDSGCKDLLLHEMKLNYYHGDVVTTLVTRC